MYARPKDAIAAFRALDKKPFQGRLLHIIGAIDRNNSTATSDHGGNPKSLREQRSEKRRATAGKEFNWGMLYMNVSEHRCSRHSIFAELHAE